MLFAALVVAQGLLVLEFLQQLLVNLLAVAETLANPFELVQQESCVAFRLRDELVHDGVLDFYVLELQATRVVAERAENERAQVVAAEGRKQYQLAAAQQCPVHFETRVFGGGAYERHRAVFHGAEQCVLLAFVKAVDFVDEEDGVQKGLLHLARVGEDFLDFLHAACHGRERDEALLGLLADYVREARLAAAGRPPENHARDGIVFQAPAQKALLAQNLVLA